MIIYIVIRVNEPAGQQNGVTTRLLILIQLNVSRFFLFIRVQVPPLRLLFAMCGLFSFLVTVFQHKINK